MTSAVFGRGLPMTDEEFLALGETLERVELFDGSLFVTPAATPRHQHLSRRLAARLDTGAEAAGLSVFEAVNVRLQSGRIAIPDVVVVAPIDVDDPFVNPADVRFVCEIVSPSNASADKILKMHFYAAAGIPWYLLVEQDNGTLHLYSLSGDKYAEHSVTSAGQALHLAEPFAATIRPEDLLPR